MFFLKVVKHPIITTSLHCHSLLRSDHPQHAVRFPHEDQEGVVVLRSRAPPAGSALVSAPPHPPDHQLPVFGADGCGGGGLPPLKPLCAVSPGESSLLWADSVWGNHVYNQLWLLSWLVGGLGKAKKNSWTDVYLLVSLSLPFEEKIESEGTEKAHSSTLVTY